MPEQRRKYRTRQRDQVSSYLIANAEQYLSVDDVWIGISSEGENVGRSTVYRCLESMVAEGVALKATSPAGEAQYRISQGETAGQLVCLECRRAFPLDCHMVADFSNHVLEHHSFRIDPARTVLYGLCEACQKERR